jgi:nitrate reductase (cytochrome), electron transfer subunit
MMNASDQTRNQLKKGRVFLIFAGICILALPLVVLAAFSQNEGEAPPKAQPAAAQPMDFDYQGRAVFENYDRIVQAYLAGHSTERTLEAYYSRRQYPGAPPVIPHKVEDNDGQKMACLACHEKGGWTAELKRHTPLTPHPEQTACRQCHLPESQQALFQPNIWMSVSPPVLGRAYLPGGPPPIPHDLQMRGNCIACHVGPGAVTAIRVQHEARGNCRQCHVPDLYGGLFQRPTDQ